MWWGGEAGPPTLPTHPAGQEGVVHSCTHSRGLARGPQGAWGAGELNRHPPLRPIPQVKSYEEYFREHPEYRKELDRAVMSRPENQKNLLCEVLMESQMGADGKKGAGAAGGAGGVRRGTGSLAALTGADDMHYAEYQRASGATKTNKTAPARKKPRIFKAGFR